MRAVLAKLSSCLLPAALLAAPVPARAGGPEREQAFDIAEQPLDTALAAYFRATGVQLLYDSAVTAGRRSAAVRGRFTARAALARLVAPAGIAIHYTRPDAAVLTGTPDAAAAPVPLGRIVVRAAPPAPAPSPLDRLIYYRQLEEALTAWLAADPRTAALAFAALVEIRISAAGRISEVRVQRGTGSARTDRLLGEVLSQAPVRTPPDGVAQPLLVTVRGQRPDEER